jgi:hypothetical protein
MEKTIDTSDEILNKIEISSIFKHFGELYDFSNKLLQDLKNALNKYDEKGPKVIRDVYANNFLNKVFLDFSANYESAMDAINRIKKDILKYESIENIFRKHRNEFHKSGFSDFHYNLLQHFFSYRLELGEIQKCVFEEDLYKELEDEMEYLEVFGANMNKSQGESEQVRKFFALQEIINNYPVDFISSHRKLINEYDVTANGRQFPKHIYLFNDCIMVVTVTKEARKKGFQYDLENIIFFKDYEFSKKVEKGHKDCIKCVCTISQKELDSHYKSNRGGKYKVSKASKPQSKINYFYFNEPISCKAVYQQYIRYQRSKSVNSTSSQ